MIKSFFQTAIGTILGVIIGALLGAFWFLKMIEEDRPTHYKSRHVSYSEMPIGRDLKEKEYKFNQMTPFTSLAKAENVLAHLRETINLYDAATVADFYEEIGLKPKPIDEKYGWNTLVTARIQKGFDTCKLILPKPWLLYN